MNLLNIANVGKTVYLFCRDENGNQIIEKDIDFTPFFYEPDENGKYVSYDGKRLTKVFSSNPTEIREMASPESYSSDIRYVNNYIVEKVDVIEKCPIKYFFLDIEILTKDLPDVNEAKLPVSCITIYNSGKKEYKTFFISDYEGSVLSQERDMLCDMVNYFQEEKPDLWLSWNVDFDYIYLHNRISKFAKTISPISVARARRAVKEEGDKDVFYPAGISILDYLSMFKKVNMRESSYKLDSVAEKYLGVGKKYKKVDFSKLSEDIRNRNIEDVELLVKLEEKFKIIDYFNEIRMFSKALWEDLGHNSLIIDSIVLVEAKQRGVVLPNKMSKILRESTDEELEGAYRRSESGVFENIYKADVASMYPNQLVNFCLDPANILEGSKTKGDFEAILIQDTYFKQDKNAILPYLAIQLMTIKDNLKKELKGTQINSENSKILQMKYDAYKGLVNSLFGVTAFPSFRLYNNQVASAITFLARDLLHYTEDAMQAKGCRVIGLDTDALMYISEKDEIDYLNSLVGKWAKEKYNKDDCNIRFEAEGKFTKLIVLGKCHYYGYIDTGKGIKREIKGVEVKRSSSSKYESFFQENLIEKILNKESKVSIINWIESEKIRVKKLPIEEVSFPCKLRISEYKKSLPIFIRAYENTRNLCKDFKMTIGENFFYTFVESLGKDKNGKDINVLAFSQENKEFMKSVRIDWNEIIRRCINSKSDNLFESIGWKFKNKEMAIATLF